MHMCMNALWKVTAGHPTLTTLHHMFSDNVWVLGKAILEADSVDPLIVRDAITGVAAAHTGTIGTINLNEFGDFATPSYSLWGVRDGQWHMSGHFDADNGTFSFT